MVDPKPPVAGYAAVMASLLPASLILVAHLMTVAVLDVARAEAALYIQVATWMLTCTVVLVLWGTTRMRQHVHDLTDALARALNDPVTGLPVRRLAEDAIEAGTGNLLTAALLDVNGLHEINDGPGGHTAGDQCLREVGQRLRLAAAGDLVARVGSDEFAVISHRSPQEPARSLAQAFTATAANGQTPAVSIGICCMPGGDAHQLLGCAELAMVAAKRQHTGIEFYDPCRDGSPPPHGRPG